MTETELRERLAAYAHNAWAGWLRWMFEKGDVVDGQLVIPEFWTARWKRQSHAKYNNLPASEQKSDLEEADKIIQIVKEYYETPVS